MDRNKAMFPRSGLAAVLLLLWIAVSITAARGEANQSERDSATRVAELLKQLGLPDSNDNLQRRRDAARRLSESEQLPTEAIAPLVKALDTWDRGGVQRYAGIALSGAGARAIPALAAECGQSGRDGEGCQAAIGVLGQIARSEPAAWPVLIDDFKSGFGAGAADAIGKVGALVVPLLRQALKSDNPSVRAMAAMALSEIGPPAREAIPDLLPLLKDPAGEAQAASGLWPSPVVQYEAAFALANIDPTRKEVLPVLIRATSNKWTTGGEAIDAIGKMGKNGREAIPALERLLADESHSPNRSGAVEALAKIEGCSAGPVLARVLKNDKDSNVRFHAARTLADLGADCPETVPALVAALADNQIDSASQLARLGKPGLAALIPGLQNRDLDVRRRVVEALWNLTLKAPPVGKPGELPDELVRPLMVALNDKSITIREQAARALQSAGGEPEHLAVAELERESKAHAQESTLDRTPRTRVQITATIPPDADHKYPLMIEYLFPIYPSIGIEEPAYLISLHRGRERSDRLVFWKNIGEGKYEQVKVMESPELDLSEGRFLPPKVFRAKVLVLGEGRSFNEGQQFVDVPQNGCNTWCVVDNVFAINAFAIRGGDFIPVQIESPKEWYKSRLRPGQSTWNSNGNSFSDDRLSFRFSIWAGEDPHASPSAGDVTGTYKIIRQTNSQPVVAGVAGLFPLSLPNTPYAASSRGDHLVTTWKMVVDTAEREPAVRR